MVVVGDQSSGKSSLLEALTRLPFPVASVLCTRFATQIVFRRTAPTEVERIRVTIIPSEEGGDQRKAALREFAYDVKSLNAEDFNEILAAVRLLPNRHWYGTNYILGNGSNGVAQSRGALCFRCSFF